MNKKGRFRNFIKGRFGERGAAAVEFALVAPVFLMFVLGIMDVSRLFFIKNLMEYGVEQAARYVMVNPDVTQSALETYADSQVSGLFTGITFTADAPGDDVVDDVHYRTITASYSFSYMMPFVTIGALPLSATSRTPVNASE
jgi:Flp pilus assembly protein TadG